MTPLRVMHVVTSLEPGGMENGVCNLATALAPRGITTRVACLERSGPFSARLPDAASAEVLGKRNGFSPSAVLRLWKSIRRHQPHILHTHNLGPLIYGALASMWGRSAKLVHGEHSMLAPWELTPKRRQQRRILYRACGAIHTVSAFQREELLTLGFPGDRISVIANGVDTAKFTPRDRQAARRFLSLPETSTVIGLAGRFGPHKGHRAFLAAFAKIAETIPDAALLLIGGGGSEETAVFQAICEHPFRSRIHVMGFREDLEECYPALDLLVLPSTNEGMSNVALEAMACGVPVLANSGAGNEAIIRDGESGWIADLRDADTFANRLNDTLQNKAGLRTAGATARQTVESRFALGQMVDAYEQLYRRLAN